MNKNEVAVIDLNSFSQLDKKISSRILNIKTFSALSRSDTIHIITNLTMYGFRNKTTTIPEYKLK